MEELIASLENEVNSRHEKGILTEAAKKWANYVLDTHTGKLTKRGLAISKALVEYENELERRK